MVLKMSKTFTKLILKIASDDETEKTNKIPMLIWQ